MTKNVRQSPWLTLGADSDHVRLARLLRRAHAIALDTGVAPRVVRQVVSESWRRSSEAGVDPGRPAPRMLDAKHTAMRLAAHPVAPLLPRVSGLLKEAMVESGYFAAFSDADGVLLWSEGSPRALRSAVAPRFLPGFLCSEDRIGTNAIGTALVLDTPVQIFSAEHFNQLLHGWTCAAAPIRDPDSGEVLGAIDLSGEFRTAHLHGLALVTAVATVTEAWLAMERRRADDVLLRRYRERCGSRPRPCSGVVAASGRVVHADPPEWLGSRVAMGPDASRWPQPDGTSIEVEQLGDGFLVWRVGGGRPPAPRVTVAVLGRSEATVLSAGRRRRLHLRHSEIVALLALNPAGMTVRELAHALYGDPSRAATVRAEVTRLRAILDGVVLSRPYRLDERLDVDAAGVQRCLDGGDLAGAARRYAGPLLPRSVAPGIAEARARLSRAVAGRAAFGQP